MQTENNTQIIMTSEIVIRSGDEESLIGFQMLPKNQNQSFWLKSSPFITVNIRETDTDKNLRILSVRAVNEKTHSIEGEISVTLDDGTCAKCKVCVLPELTKAPAFEEEPRIILKDGKAVLQYELARIHENIDESDISWYRVDGKNRANFDDVSLKKQSNERDSRKIAVSLPGRPCREIMLSSADIGKVIRANIKPKHNNSHIGQALNVESNIITENDITDGVIVLDIPAIVTDDSYEIESGYFTAKGLMRKVICKNFHSASGLMTASMGCGIYYNNVEEIVNDMKLIVVLDPEKEDGNGFNGPRQYEEIYIKYDAMNKNGYGLRISGTASDDGNVMFGLYKYKNGNGTLISEEHKSSAFRPGCEICLQTRGDVLNAFITFDDGEDFADLELTARIRPNGFGGFGFKHMAEIEDGSRVCLKYMEARY